MAFLCCSVEQYYFVVVAYIHREWMLLVSSTVLLTLFMLSLSRDFICARESALITKHAHQKPRFRCTPHQNVRHKDSFIIYLLFRYRIPKLLDAARSPATRRVCIFTLGTTDLKSFCFAPNWERENSNGCSSYAHRLSARIDFICV